MASAETTSAGISSLRAAATSDFPLAVGPKMPMTRSATETRADELEILVCHAGREEVRLHAAVVPLELGEHADHRGRGRLRNALEPFELLVALGGCEPFFVAGAQPLLAKRVVRCD